ncbi:MAG: alanine racemase [Pseudomonadota bacterium]
MAASSERPLTAPATAAPGWSRPRLTIDLSALAGNWRALDRLSGRAETAAVVKADAYGCGLAPAARALRAAGARTFFVAQTPEGAALREALGPGPVIYVFNGFMDEDAELQAAHDLRPVLNAPDQLARLAENLSAFPVRPKIGVHIETGMNRMAFTSRELDGLRAGPLPEVEVALVMSHLACADDPRHSMNPRQRIAFASRAALTQGFARGAALSLAATGGILLGEGYHFDLVRPGVGLYGGLPFAEAKPVAHLEAPFLQIREIPKGESVGYGCTWTAPRPSRIGVLPVGYADGFHRIASPGARVVVEGRPAPLVGRVSMDMITVDLTDLPEPAPGATAQILGDEITVDELAGHAGTIGYEILTALGRRHVRRHINAPA